MCQSLENFIKFFVSYCSGGKESRTYGVDARTGTLLYECSMQGCENTSVNSSEVEEVLVLKRLTHTVRAVEPRTSFER